MVKVTDPEGWLHRCELEPKAYLNTRGDPEQVLRYLFERGWANLGMSRIEGTIGDWAVHFADIIVNTPNGRWDGDCGRYEWREQ